MINPDDWQPIGIEDLEQNAWNALRYRENCLVTAGPGAGKTEFLTQKALYLLQTGLCPYPQRILAISFKKDAAKNLKDRVLLRSTPKQASRFDSMTYDAFAKSIVDKFIKAIPVRWRPNAHYQISFLDRDALRYLDLRIDFEKNTLSHIKLDLNSILPVEQLTNIINIWQFLEVETENAKLTYTMINRLAECILRLNPFILKALRLTYPVVFMDEFQDTTYAQYDLIKTAFHDSSSSLTAVGDDKQKIMLWAGALPEAFNQFCAEFMSEPFDLLSNYRSRPELVQIQHIVARAMNPSVAIVQSRTEANINGDFSAIWIANNPQEEAEYLAYWIATDMANNRLTPRDYCLLTRQRTDDIENDLREKFASRALTIRNESRKINDVMIQDILSEDISHFIINFIKVITGQAPDALFALYDIYDFINDINVENEQAISKNHNKLDNIIRNLQQELRNLFPTQQSLEFIISQFEAHFDLNKIKAAYPQYASSDFDQLLTALKLFMQENLATNISWQDWIAKLIGENQIPLMTIHKSKGLEFHTVLFLRLDDEQWWSYSSGSLEGRATFFVALSRAKQRVFFTYCRNKSLSKVTELYQLLKSANIRGLNISSS